MPSTLTFPGVYIEEVPSGVRTITGVATAITAFVGRTLRGPTDRPKILNSYGDFERVYGGLWKGSKLPYAVRDFFLNGGGQAVVARLAHSDAAKRTITVDVVQLEASSPGAWAAGLRVSLDTTDVSTDVANGLGLVVADLFNITITDATAGVAERFRNVSLRDSDRKIDTVLAAGSELVRWANGVIVPNQAAPAPGADDVTTAERALAQTMQDTPADAAAITAARDAVNAAIDAVRTAVKTFDGTSLDVNDFLPNQAEAQKLGLFKLAYIDLFNILCIPPYTLAEDVDVALVSASAAYCERRRAMLLVDPPSAWTTKDKATVGFVATPDEVGTRSRNAALFFPRLRQPDPLCDNQLADFAPCGAVAGVFARTDTQRGVWKSPAGLDATLVGVPQLAVPLTDAENGELNPIGVNCLRTFRDAGRVVWGSRTLRGSDGLADEYKYIAVRRMALFLEESLYRGTQWVVFEPNDEPLWAQIRLNIGAFLNSLFRQGAFQGKTPRDAYFVKCDSDTTRQDDINRGIVNIIVGFAPLKPAEFVVIKFQQMAGQIDV